MKEKSNKSKSADQTNSGNILNRNAQNYRVLLTIFNGYCDRSGRHLIKNTRTYAKQMRNITKSRLSACDGRISDFETIKICLRAQTKKSLTFFGHVFSHFPRICGGPWARNVRNGCPFQHLCENVMSDTRVLLVYRQNKLVKKATLKYNGTPPFCVFANKPLPMHR